ncbi:MAG: hypothetical protein ABIG66_00125 [Candidatus Kerfeldbacteria bacterium]
MSTNYSKPTGGTMTQDDLEQSPSDGSTVPNEFTVEKAVVGMSSLDAIVALPLLYGGLGYCVITGHWGCVMAWVLFGLLVTLRYHRYYGYPAAFLLWPMAFVVGDNIRDCDES